MKNVVRLLWVPGGYFVGLMLGKYAFSPLILLINIDTKDSDLKFLENVVIVGFTVLGFVISLRIGMKKR